MGSDSHARLEREHPFQFIMIEIPTLPLLASWQIPHEYAASHSTPNICYLNAPDLKRILQGNLLRQKFLLAQLSSVDETCLEIYVAQFRNNYYNLGRIEEETMQWVALSYSLPPKSSSSPRVNLWRRLRRLGAVSPAGSLYLLPARDECIEGFEWLAQEIQQLKGQALVMRVEEFTGMTDQELVELFRASRGEDYQELETELAELEKEVDEAAEPESYTRIRDTLARLQRKFSDIARIDYFNCPEGTSLAARMARVTQALASSVESSPEIETAKASAYKSRKWVTRPQPHVDRLACAWLIRRYIDDEAVIRYSLEPEPDEVTFDMSGAEFGHTGNLCSFETMLRAFDLNAPRLLAMAEIVHEIDLRDEFYPHPESQGIDAILKGWLMLNLSNTELESRGIALFDGLFEHLGNRIGQDS